jgi:hypothetical protein
MSEEVESAAVTEKTPASAQLQLAGEAFIHFYVPTPAQLLALASKRKKIPEADLADFLATISALHAALGSVPAHLQGTRNVPVPEAVLNMIGTILVGRRKWGKAGSKRRREVAHALHEQWRQETVRLRQRNPHLYRFDSEVARTIVGDAKAHGVELDVGTVRKAIAGLK